MSRVDDALERLFQVATVLGDAMAEDLAARGLTRARATLLAQLHRTGPSNQRALATALRVTPRNITGLVDALEEAGLVARSRHPEDRRATLVSLTEAGARAAAAMAKDERALARFLFGDGGIGDLESLVSGLDKVLGRLSGPEFETLRGRSLDRWPGTS